MDTFLCWAKGKVPKDWDGAGYGSQWEGFKYKLESDCCRLQKGDFIVWEVRADSELTCPGQKVYPAVVTKVELFIEVRDVDVSIRQYAYCKLAHGARR